METEDDFVWTCVRRYKDKPVEEKKLERCLEAALLSPGWRNRQCCHMVVVRDKGTIAEITTGANSWARPAPVMVAVCTDPSLVEGFSGEMDFFVDITMVMQQLVSVANDMGLATCFFESFEEKKVKGLLGIPEGIRVVAITPLGYPKSGKRGAAKKVPALSGSREDLGIIAYDEEWGKPFGSPKER